MPEVANRVTMKGNPVTLIGHDIQIGEGAPDCTLIANDLSEVKLSSFKGKKIVLSVVPSLDTPVCDQQTRRFNEEAAKMPGEIAVLTVSMDLPFAQKRFCSTAGIDKIKVLSDHRDAFFGSAYGVLIKELRLNTRAIFIVSPDNKIQYAEYVPEMTSHPNYDAALGALKTSAR